MQTSPNDALRRTVPGVIRALAVMLLLSLPSRCLAQGDTLRGFLNTLQKPVVFDADSQRKDAPKGTMLVDELVIYALRDGGGRRFCISYYGHYGESWLTEHKQGLFVVLPRPVEKFGWGGFGTTRRSQEETEIATMIADATHTEPKTFLNPPK
jgi:hypothetical protein